MKPATLYDAYLGLDIGKTKIYVCLVLNERQPKQKVMYGNNRPIWELTCLQRIC